MTAVAQKIILALVILALLGIIAKGFFSILDHKVERINDFTKQRILQVQEECSRKLNDQQEGFRHSLQEKLKEREKVETEKEEQVKDLQERVEKLGKEKADAEKRLSELKIHYEEYKRKAMQSNATVEIE